MATMIEVACFELKAALLAVEAGADRIEFCADYESGGITPPLDEVKILAAKLKIPLHVIVRPRAGNFFYGVDELDQMKRSVEFCRKIGVAGVVAGVLDEYSRIHLEQLRELMNCAGNMSFTFHRAIDDSENIGEAVTKLVELGIKRVLSSGGKKNALEGLATLKKMKALAGTKTIIIPGGGVRSSNIEKFLQAGFTEVHTAAMSEGFFDVQDLKKMILLKRQYV